MEAGQVEECVETSDQTRRPYQAWGRRCHADKQSAQKVSSRGGDGNDEATSAENSSRSKDHAIKCHRDRAYDEAARGDRSS